MSLKKGILLELQDDYNEPVRDPLWKNIYLTRGMKALISSGPMQKLHNIRQLGPTYLVYPGATHTRFAHSLGVFYLAKRLISRLVSFDECIDLDGESVRSFLCAALLHDLGHFPYAHSLKELPLEEHETLTARMLMEEPIRGILKNEIKADPETAAAIVDESIDPGDRRDIRFFRKILSGVLDPDKLDYLNRDAYYCGVPYGFQDTDFVLDRLRPLGEELYLSEGGLPALENILFSKYLMYRTVYWHKTVRIATAMIKKAVFSGMNEGIIKPEDLYGLSDEEFHSRYAGDDHAPFELIRKVKTRDLYKSVYEVPFNQANPLHQDLLTIEKRSAEEGRIVRRLIDAGISMEPHSCIIDVPENISFKIDIPILKDTDSLTPFTAPAVKSFKDSLRRIRLILPPDSLSQIQDPGSLVAW